MHEAESQALQIAQNDAIERYAEDHRFKAADICALHRSWLWPIYDWAGDYRAVDLTKQGFRFAHAAQIPRLMQAMLMGLQAGLPPLDLSPMLGRGRHAYFEGIHSALGRDYKPLARQFGKVIDRTLKNAASNSR